MTLIQRLALRHANDLWVPECKDGATQTRNHRRIDGWAMLRTWTPPTIIGYECKISRSDWVRDQKFGDYRTMCHLLYVVADKGIVAPGELPDGVGLMEPLGADRLKTVRKAARYDGPISESVYQYVLMCRAVIKSEWPPDDRESRVRRYAQMMASAKEVGEAVSLGVSKSVIREKARADDAVRRANNLEHIEKRLIELGLDPRTPSLDWALTEKLGEWSRRRNLAVDMLRRSREELDRTIRVMEAQ